MRTWETNTPENRERLRVASGVAVPGREDLYGLSPPRRDDARRDRKRRRWSPPPDELRTKWKDQWGYVWRMPPSEGRRLLICIYCDRAGGFGHYYPKKLMQTWTDPRRTSPEQSFGTKRTYTDYTRVEANEYIDTHWRGYRLLTDYDWYWKGDRDELEERVAFHFQHDYGAGTACDWCGLPDVLSRYRAAAWKDPWSPSRIRRSAGQIASGLARLRDRTINRQKRQKNRKLHGWAAPPDDLRAKWRDELTGGEGGLLAVPYVWEMPAKDGYRIEICVACRLASELGDESGIDYPDFGFPYLPAGMNPLEGYTRTDAYAHINANWTGYRLLTKGNWDYDSDEHPLDRYYFAWNRYDFAWQGARLTPPGFAGPPALESTRYPCEWCGAPFTGGRFEAAAWKEPT